MGRPPKRPRRTADPAVILDLVCERGVFMFVLTNRGSQPARDISVKFRRKIFGMGGDLEITALPLWSRLSFMPPGKEIRVPIDIAARFLARDGGKHLTLVVTYSDGEENDLWSSEITHDFTAYKDMPELL